MWPSFLTCKGMNSSALEAEGDVCSAALQVTASTSVLMILFSSSAIALSFYFQGLLNVSYAQVIAPLCFAASLIGEGLQPDPCFILGGLKPCLQPAAFASRDITLSCQAELTVLSHIFVFRHWSATPKREDAEHVWQPWGSCGHFSFAAGVLVVGRIIRKTGRASIIVLILSALITIG